MKKVNLLFCLVILLTGTISTRAQTAEETEKWMEYMTPADMQKMLAKWDGEWEEAITMWMAPGAPPQEMKATCENKMILDGRYQESHHEGSFMGMPFQGISVTGFDNARKIFVSSWIDNFGTGMMFMEGSWNKDTKSIDLKGTMTDPTSGKPLQIRQVLKAIDDNNQLMQQFTTMDGKEFKSMEIKLTRKK